MAVSGMIEKTTSKKTSQYIMQKSKKFEKVKKSP